MAEAFINTYLTGCVFGSILGLYVAIRTSAESLRDLWSVKDTWKDKALLILIVLVFAVFILVVASIASWLTVIAALKRRISFSIKINNK